MIEGQVTDLLQAHNCILSLQKLLEQIKQVDKLEKIFLGVYMYV